MDIYEAIKNRHSTRSYQDKAVEDDKLKRILNAGRCAPSARNRQELKFIVVRDSHLRNALAAASNQPFVVQAPVIIAVVGLTPDEKMHCDIPTDPVDCAIAIDHMTLAAVAEGLGTCWVGHFEQGQCRQVLSVPDTAKIVELLPLGYPAGEPVAKNRKPLEEIVCYDQFK